MTLKYPYNRLIRIIDSIWDTLQDENQWSVKEEEDFEILVGDIIRNRRKCGLTEVWRGQQREGLSGVIHQFDLCVRVIPEIDDEYHGKNAGIVIECKTFNIKNLISRINKKKYRPQLLSKEEVETFIFKSYDVFLERDLFPGMELSNVYLLIVTTKPPTREAFLISTIYGVTLIYPQVEAFQNLLRSHRRKLGDLKINTFLNTLANSSIFDPPPPILIRDYARLSAPDEKVRQLEHFLLRWFKMNAGNLPRRGINYSYLLENYRQFLNYIRSLKRDGKHE